MLLSLAWKWQPFDSARQSRNSRDARIALAWRRPLKSFPRAVQVLSGRKPSRWPGPPHVQRAKGELQNRLPQISAWFDADFMLALAWVLCLQLRSISRICGSRAKCFAFLPPVFCVSPLLVAVTVAAYAWACRKLLATFP